MRELRSTKLKEKRVGLEILSEGVAWVAQRSWTILSKTASALTGRKIPVRAGSAPYAAALRSPKELDTIYLPSLFLPRTTALKATLGHECLHILESTPIRLGEISYAIWLLSNGLEDARIETQQESRFPGIRRWIHQLLYSQEFALSLKQLEVTGEAHQAFSAVVKALYILLAHRDPVLARRVSGYDEAVVLAQDLRPQAEEALYLKNTNEIIELAKRLLQELEQAIKRREQTAQSQAAASFYRSASQQLYHAQSIKASDVIKIVEKLYDEYQNRWYGPWMRGGGFSFAPTPWEVEESEEGKILVSLVPGSYQLLEWLLEADPLKDQVRYIERQRIGRLTTSASALVKAATGKYRHVFSYRDDRPQPILPAILQQANYWLLMEAHMRYSEEDFKLLKLLGASYARLFELLEIPFLVRAWSATIPEVRELDEKGQWKTYKAKEGKLHIAPFHSPPKRWAQDELKFLSIRPKGFNLPFEGTPKCLSYRDSGENKTENQEGKKEKQKQKIVMCFGDLDHLNVYLSDLKGTLSSLCQQGYRFVYFNLGEPPEIEYLKQWRKELKEIFGQIVDFQDLRAGYIRGLQALLELLVDKTRLDAAS